jgi:hypothetical protein
MDEHPHHVTLSDCTAVLAHAGKMELFSAAFYPAVLAVLDDPRLLVLGTVPVARYGRTIPQVGDH